MAPAAADTGLAVAPPRPPARPSWLVEWRLVRRERGVWWLAALLVATLAYGTWNGASWAMRQQAITARIALEESARIDSLRDVVARRAAGDSTGARAPLMGVLGASSGARTAILPMASLAPLAVGVSDLFPTYQRVTTAPRETAPVADEIENPHHLLAGRFDLAFALVFVFPLILLALTFNVVSAEREQGTMALLLAQPVAIGRLLLTKLAVRVGFVVVVALVASLGGAAAAGVPLSEASTWRALAAWALVVMAYGAFWVGVAVAINATGRSSATSALMGLGAWLLAVVLVPALMAAAVTAWHPAPSRVGLITTLRAVRDSVEAQGDTAVTRFLADHPELATGARLGGNRFARAIAVQEEAGKALRPAIEAFDAAVASQRRAAERLGWLSPAIVAQDALFDVAGRGLPRQRDFDAQVAAFHQHWQAYFFGRIYANAPVDASTLEALPAFEYAEASAANRRRRLGTQLLALLLPAAALLGWGVPRLQRPSLLER